MKLLFVIREPFPTFRADVKTLFGKYLPRHGIQSTLVAQARKGISNKQLKWGGGELILSRHVNGGRVRSQLLAFSHDLKAFRMVDESFDAVQVRDKILSGIIGLWAARRTKVPFFYWMSFPFPEDDLYRARVQGLSLGLIRLIFTWLRGHLSALLLYRFLLPKADHVFVQSDRMKEDLIDRRVSEYKMTPVPMGIDLELVENSKLPDIDDGRLSGKRFLVYLGALDRTRQIDFLFEVLVRVRREEENVFLLLVGDTVELENRVWLKKRTKEIGVQRAVIWTGWLPRETAWQYVKSAEIGICAIPPGFIFNSSSPTKTVEYLALGLPIVVNDLPDQAEIVRESGGGLCVQYTVEDFSKTILKLLRDRKSARQMGINGQNYIRRTRSYSVLSSKLAQQYRKLLLLKK